MTALRHESEPAPESSAARVEDIHLEQIQVGGRWYHAQRVFGRAASTFQINDLVPELVPRSRKTGHPPPDEVVQSDLFRESGANISHTRRRVQAYAQAMNSYGGWGEFPPIVGYVSEVTREEVEQYLALGAAACELAYSRPLTMSDIGRRIVHIWNGHTRAYAARSLGLEIPVYDMNVEEQDAQRYDKPASS